MPWVDKANAWKNVLDVSYAVSCTTLHALFWEMRPMPFRALKALFGGIFTLYQYVPYLDKVNV